MMVFVDASFLIALFHQKDDFHQEAEKIIKKIEAESVCPLISNIVSAEAVNFIFRLKGQMAAQRFLAIIRENKIKEVFVDQESFAKSYQLLFVQKSKRGLSFFDCLHLVTMKTLGIDTILSFDKGFKKEVKVIGI